MILIEVIVCRLVSDCMDPWCRGWVNYVTFLRQWIRWSSQISVCYSLQAIPYSEQHTRALKTPTFLLAGNSNPPCCSLWYTHFQPLSLKTIFFILNQIVINFINAWRQWHCFCSKTAWTSLIDSTIAWQRQTSRKAGTQSHRPKSCGSGVRQRGCRANAAPSKRAGR